MRLRFHWSLSAVGDKFRRARPTAEIRGLLPVAEQIEFCRKAEECGMDSLLMAVGFTRPDPVVLSSALGMVTSKIKFMIACRPGLVSPTLFVQQINTISTLTRGRVSINIVAGHTPHELRYYGDKLSHDERYNRTDEFLSICRAFWSGSEEVNFEGKHFSVEGGRLNTPFVSESRSAPEIYLGGNSRLAEDLAIRHASCLWQFAQPPEIMEPKVAELRDSGVEAGILVSLISRATRDEAVRDATSMVAGLSADKRAFGREFALATDSVAFRSTQALAESSQDNWLTKTLWTGAVPYLGSPSISLVGSYEDIAAAILDYRSIGVTQFLFMGWPDLEEMTRFAGEIAPLVQGN